MVCSSCQEGALALRAAVGAVTVEQAKPRTSPVQIARSSIKPAMHFATKKLNLSFVGETVVANLILRESPVDVVLNHRVSPAYAVDQLLLATWRSQRPGLAPLPPDRRPGRWQFPVPRAGRGAPAP